MSDQIGAMELDIEKIDHVVATLKDSLEPATQPSPITVNTPVRKDVGDVERDNIDHNIMSNLQDNQHINNLNNNIQPNNNMYNTDNQNTHNQNTHNKKLPLYNQDDRTHRNRDQNNHVDNNQQGNRSLKKVLLLMDSNRNHLDQDRLWKNLHLIPCGSIPEVKSKVNRNDISGFDVIVIHVGVNDIDRLDGKNVAAQLVQLVGEIRLKAPNAKFVLSEVTPRQLKHDNRVLECNKELKDLIKSYPYVTLARHSNLRNNDWSFHKKNDDKHLAEDSIARLAGNLKSAFRRAIGMDAHRDNRKKNNTSHSRGGNSRTSNIADIIRNELKRFLNPSLNNGGYDI